MEIDYNEDALELFWYWILERDHIRALKERGTPPEWSEDPIFQTQHFCNVRREHDRGTIEIHEAVLGANVPVEFLPYWYTIARMFNKAQTVREALRAWNDSRHWPSMLKALRADGHKLFHTAYVVSTCGKSMDKVDYVANVANAVQCRNTPRFGLGRAYQELLRVNGLGSFMAGQIVADLRNSPYLAPENKVEGKMWCVPGPGSIKGLRYIFNHFTLRGFTTYIQELYFLMPPEVRDMNIHAQDLQNCLCEFSKYMRIKNGDPGRRRPYHNVRKEDPKYVDL